MKLRIVRKQFRGYEPYFVIERRIAFIWFRACMRIFSDFESTENRVKRMLKENKEPYSTSVVIQIYYN